MTTSRSLTVSRDTSHPAEGGGRLPRPLTSLLGRKPDVATVSALLAAPDIQIVTLLGPGGVGKTRLAIAVAERMGNECANGIRFAGLSSIRDAALAPAVVAHALGIREQPGVPLIDRVEAMAGDLRLLLVIDNLEHLPDTAPFLARIAERCPDLKLLCTSRARLGISGEHVYATPPLPPDAAIDLFTQRAGAISSRFRDGNPDAEAIAELCERLDHLPLAIELAATRVPVLSPHEILRGLGDRFSILASGPRDGSDRHHDLRVAIAWSYDLLDEHDRALFRRLAVFSGGFTLDSAQAVVGDGAAILEGMARLEASSLVQQMASGGAGTRFTLLESIREFALEQLAACGDMDEARRAHATLFVRAFDGSDLLWWLPEGVDRLNLIEVDIANVRTALAWLKGSGEIEDFLRLAGALGPLWASRGYSLEGQAHLEWGLARSDGVCRDTVIAALWSLSWVLNQHGDNYRALVTAQEGFRLAEMEGKPARMVQCLIVSGVGAHRMGQSDMALGFQEHAYRILEACRNQAWTRIATCLVMNQFAYITLLRGDLDATASWYTRTQAFQQEYGIRHSHAGHPLMGLGDVARARGEPAAALPHYQAALRVMRDARDIRARAYVVAAIAGTLAALGEFDLAARLFGAAEAEHERIALPFDANTFDRQRAMGLPQPWWDGGVHDRIHEPLFRALKRQTAVIRNTRLDPDQARLWWAEGRGIPFDEATALALAAVAAPNALPAPPGGLSAREIDVLRLLARGLTDNEIARTLSISRRTASNHVHHIYTKLGVGSRSSATAWAIRNELA